MDTARPRCRYLPNCITTLRILATACLIFIKPFSAAFYAVYSFAGISDVLDGWLARKLKLTSDFGAQLDSAADLFFYTTSILRIYPVLWNTLPRMIWVGVWSTVGVRLFSYSLAAVKFRRFASLHTYVNKVTGLMVFTLPYVIKTAFAAPYSWCLCAVAAFGTLEELLIHIFSREYDPNHKTLASLR